MPITSLPKGVFPTMITPFTDEGAVDWPVLQGLVEWYIAAGCSGLFAVCLSSEMYDLTDDERIELARAVKKYARDRVPVVATGTFGGPLEDQAAFMTKMAAEVDAVVIITSLVAEEAADAATWKANCEKLLSLTEGPLGFYECPVPYKRVLTPEELKWAAGTGRFLFHKDTCCDTAQITAKLDAIRDLPTPFRFYNANVETLAFSNGLGGAGFSGISANFYPFLHARLCAEDPPLSEKDSARLQRFVSLAEATVCDLYPKSAKGYLAHVYPGLPIKLTTRAKHVAAVQPNEIQRLHWQHMKESVEELCASLDQPITPVAPALP
mmetsp:Transcript_21479/g.52204  ORF Transcript_21479/g.52204 Transcript_21479/m.52204 type:complete len:323 (+) Transcript_21479:30-998(+)